MDGWIATGVCSHGSGVILPAFATLPKPSSGSSWSSGSQRPRVRHPAKRFKYIQPHHDPRPLSEEILSAQGRVCSARQSRVLVRVHYPSHTPDPAGRNGPSKKTFLPGRGNGRLHPKSCRKHCRKPEARIGEPLKLNYKPLKALDLKPCSRTQCALASWDWLSKRCPFGNSTTILGSSAAVYGVQSSRVELRGSRFTDKIKGFRLSLVLNRILKRTYVVVMVVPAATSTTITTTITVTTTAAVTAGRILMSPKYYHVVGKIRY